MERQEFLKSLGFGFATVCAGACLVSCGGGDDTSTPNNPTPTPTPPPSGGGTGNTVSAPLSSLSSIGSSTKVGAVLFFRIAAGDLPSSFVATEAVCNHQGGGLNWVQNQNRIICNLHSAQFEQNGAVISGPIGGGSVRPLVIYTTTVNATSVVAAIR